MKLLLTSAGLTNSAIVDALLDLLGKPFSKANIVFIPTAANAEEGDKSWLVQDLTSTQALGWGSFQIIDIAATHGLSNNVWLTSVREADVLMVGGGNCFYLSYWLHRSGLASELPHLLKTSVYIGVSAGSMVAGASLCVASQALNNPQSFKDEVYDELGPLGQSSAKTLHLTDFVFRPHLNSPFFPKANQSFLQ
ncbi:MAG TPA: Type 1 glutamine amidotransferase-like domain-containing protein, partial [Candidatus Saccharimonadales bacterium]|nr:Type 1 glutamine amidotransferase-like domain-containing protein [Candidatus Saccharimonadales bacterium]